MTPNCWSSATQKRTMEAADCLYGSRWRQVARRVWSQSAWRQSGCAQRIGILTNR